MTDWPKNPDFEPHPAPAETPSPVVIVVDPTATERTLSLVAAPTGDGLVNGAGVYPIGTTVSAVATPNIDKHFVNWTYINGLIASVHPNYTFSLTSDTSLIANFGEGAVIPPPPEMQGPLNLFTERMLAADALNRAYDVKATYTQLGFEEPGPGDPPPPDGTPISPGGPVTIDQSKYMIDVAATRRRR